MLDKYDGFYGLYIDSLLCLSGFQKTLYFGIPILLIAVLLYKVYFTKRSVLKKHFKIISTVAILLYVIYVLFYHITLSMYVEYRNVNQIGLDSNHKSIYTVETLCKIKEVAEEQEEQVSTFIENIQQLSTDKYDNNVQVHPDGLRYKRYGSYIREHSDIDSIINCSDGCTVFGFTIYYVIDEDIEGVFLELESDIYKFTQDLVEYLPYNDDTDRYKLHWHYYDLRDGSESRIGTIVLEYDDVLDNWVRVERVFME